MREWLKRVRKSHGVTMKEMAAALSISESGYCLLENGKRCKELSVVQLQQIADALGMDFWAAAQEELHYIREVRG